MSWEKIQKKSGGGDEIVPRVDKMWLREHTPVTLACVYVAALGALAVLWLRAAAPHTTLAHAKVADATTVYALGALAWPFVWWLVCGHAVVGALPWPAYVGLAWPPLLLLADVGFATHQAYGADPHKQAASNNIDGYALSGLALAMGGLLARYVSDRFSTSAGPMLMAVVLLVLLVIMPQPSPHAHSTHANAQRAVQKVGVQWCLGFSITAVAIAFGFGMLHAPQQGAALDKAAAAAAGDAAER